MIYEVGQKVEVYDPDMGAWLPGTVEESGDLGYEGEQVLMIHTEGASLFNRPLIIGVPISMVGTSVRPR